MVKLWMRPHHIVIGNGFLFVLAVCFIIPVQYFYSMIFTCLSQSKILILSTHQQQDRRHETKEGPALKSIVALHSGTDGHTKKDETSEKFQTAFDPPPSFSENHVADFATKLRQNCDKSAYVHYGGLLCII